MTFLAAGFAAARRGPRGPLPGILAGALAGLISGAFLSAFILLSSAVNLRTFLPNASPELFELLTLGSDPVVDRLLDPDARPASWAASSAPSWRSCRAGHASSSSSTSRPSSSWGSSPASRGSAC